MDLPPHVKYYDVGRWYGVSFDGSKETPAFEFRILSENIPVLSRWAKRMATDLYFETDLARGFGIDRRIVCAGKNDGYHILRADIIHRRGVTALAERISEFLGFLSSVRDLQGADFAHDKDRAQLMIVRTDLDAGVMHAAPIGGCTSPLLTRWIEERHASEKLPTVEEAMWRAWNACSPNPQPPEQEGPYRYLGIDARTADYGGFLLDTKGNACDVSTVDRWTREEGCGHELGCHNVDTPMQQLSLLAGLAALHDLASKELDSQSPT